MVTYEALFTYTMVIISGITLVVAIFCNGKCAEFPFYSKRIEKKLLRPKSLPA